MKKILIILCVLASCSKKEEVAQKNNCDLSENIYSSQSNICSPIMCSLENSNLPNASVVSGILKNSCHIVECQPEYELINGSCIDKKPLLTLNNLSYITNGHSIALSGLCENGNVLKVNETNQSEIISSCQNGTYNIEYPVNTSISSNYPVKISAVNAKGITTTLDFSYQLDKDSPQIGINPLPIITSQNNNTINITGSCSENGKAVSINIIDSLNNNMSRTSICLFSIWSIPVPSTIIDGDITLLISQTDESGNTSQETLNALSEMSSIGIKQWSTQFGFSLTQTNSIDIIHDDEGNVYITGYTYGSLYSNTKISPNGLYDGFISKYDSNGLRIWTKQFGTVDGATGGYYITKDSNNDLFVVGNTNGNLNGNTKIGNNDSFVMKVDSNGIIKWTKQFGTGLSTDTSVKSIAIDSNDLIYIGGVTTGQFIGNTKKSPNGFMDGYLSKFDVNGNIIWAKQFGVSNGNTIVSDIDVLTTNIHLVGSTVGSLYATIANQGYNQIYYAEYNDNGILIDSKQFGTEGSTHSYGNQIAFDNSNNMYIAGTTEGVLYNAVQDNNGPSSPDTNGFIIKYNNSKVRQWVTQYASDGDTTVKKIAVDDYGNIYATGTTGGFLFENSYPDSRPDGGYLIKFSHNSQYKWSKQFGTIDAFKKTFSQSLTIFNNELYITGYTTGALDLNNQSGSADGFVIKYK